LTVSGVGQKPFSTESSI